MQDLYRCPGSIRDTIDKSLTWDSVSVEDDEVPAMLKAGWFPSIAQASKTPEEAPPTRDELERKAAELGLKFDGRTTDRKLSQMIAESV